MNQYTGLTIEQLEHLERLCHQDLVTIPAASTFIKKLSPRNLLVLTLKWLRRYPTVRDLALEFKITKSSVGRTLEHVLKILDTNLKYLRDWPANYRSKLLKEPLKDTIGAVDTFPICIEQPKSLADRKKFYIYKSGHKTRYGYKVQTFVDLRGRILNATDTYPFGSIADITLFRRSVVPCKLDATTRAMAPAPTTLASRIENRFRSRNKEQTQVPESEMEDEASEDNKEPESNDEKKEGYLIRNISEALSEEKAKASQGRGDAKALGDKAYLGSELIYAPFKRFKHKRFSPKKQEFNRVLSSNRVIVENVNKRLEDFKVLGTIYRGVRDVEVVSRIVRVIVSLHNYTLESHPMRRLKRRRRR